MMTHTMEAMIRRAVASGSTFDPEASKTAMEILLDEIDRLRATIVRLRTESAGSAAGDPRDVNIQPR